jgi:hypothetical protein
VLSDSHGSAHVAFPGAIVLVLLVVVVLVLVVMRRDKGR